MSNKIFSRNTISSGVKKTTVADPLGYQLAFDSIQTYTGNGSSGSFTFSSIPTKYKHLQIRWVVRGTRSFAGEDMYIRFNNDATNNYFVQETYANPPSTAATANSGASAISAIRQGQIPAALAPSGCYGTGIVDIYDWQSSVKTKTTKGFCGFDTNDTNTGYNYHNIWHTSGLWVSTAPVTSITVVSNGPFDTNSYISLYGVV